MWSKKTRTTVQPNNKKKTIRLALLVSFFTAVAAGIFIWRVRTSKSENAVLSKTAGKVGRGKAASEGGNGLTEMRTAHEDKQYADR